MQNNKTNPLKHARQLGGRLNLELKGLVAHGVGMFETVFLFLVVFVLVSIVQKALRD